MIRVCDFCYSEGWQFKACLSSSVRAVSESWRICQLHVVAEEVTGESQSHLSKLKTKGKLLKAER